jgi:glycosyltransferase involved in cell wall biosynthesis
MTSNYGKIVPPDNPEAMAEAVLESADRENSALKQRLREWVAQRYSWDKNVEKLVEIYEELI